MSLNVGDKVILPEYGGSKMVLDNNEYFIFYEKDIIGKFKWLEPIDWHLTHRLSNYNIIPMFLVIGCSLFVTVIC